MVVKRAQGMEIVTSYWAISRAEVELVLDVSKTLCLSLSQYPPRNLKIVYNVPMWLADDTRKATEDGRNVLARLYYNGRMYLDLTTYDTKVRISTSCREHQFISLYS
jgi:hypothetical protein